MWLYLFYLKKKINVGKKAIIIKSSNNNGKSNFIGNILKYQTNSIKKLKNLIKVKNDW